MRERVKRLVLACLAAVAAQAASAGDRALLIGIGDYPGPENDLKGPPNDVRLIKQTLISELDFPAAGILELPQEKSNKAGITAAFRDWLVSGTRSGDRVFIYYSGHGTSVPDTDHDEGAEGRDEALVMNDYGPSTGSKGLLLDDEFAKLLQMLDGRWVTVLADSCYSGSIERSLRLGGRPEATARFIPPYFEAESSRAGTMLADTPQMRQAMRQDNGLGEEAASQRTEIWTAASSYQLAWEDAPDGESNGVFTRAFVSAFRDRAADSNGNGVLSRSEMLDYVQDAAQTFCAKSSKCRGEGVGFTPTLTVAPALRSLSVMGWPEPQGGASDAAAPQAPPAPAQKPDIDQMLDLLAGGGVPADLRIRHADTRKTGPVRGGDRVVFEIVSPEGGQVILYDLRDGGLVHQLFPSAIMGKNTPATPNRPLVIPDAYAKAEFRMPPGEGALVAIIVSDPGLIERLAARNVDMRPLRDPLQELGTLMAELTGPYTGDAENRRARFGIAKLRYRAD